MRDTVHNFIREHDLLRRGDRVLVAVSGGADSVALLHLLRGLAADYDLTLHAAHLDHELRPDSSADADFVADLCAAWEIPLETARISIPVLARQSGRGLEETSREERQDFLQRTARARGCRVVALGHHRDDQAETVLQRLLRGSGASGLAAMRPRRGPFIRPLLTVTRDEIRSYLREQGLSWVEDASNSDPAFTRNRIRHRLLPLLREFNPAIGRTLAGLSERLALEEDFWELAVTSALEQTARAVPEGLQLDLPALLALHPALRARVLRQAIGTARGGLARIQACHIAAIEALALGQRPQAEVRLPGLWCGRRYDRLLLGPAPPVPLPPYLVEIGGAGSYPLPGGARLEVTLPSRPGGETPWAVEFAADEVPWPLLARPFRPGDRIDLPGGAGRLRVKELFRAARLPLEARRQWPLVFAGGLLWVPGLRRSPVRRPGAGERVLRLQLSGLEPTSKNL
jgi:tRNA(Ile)-lysidine synthase